MFAKCRIADRLKQFEKKNSPIKMLSITEINCLNFEDFTEHLKNVIEHCPVLAAALWKQKPFDSVSHMVSEMAKIVSALPLSGKL